VGRLGGGGVPVVVPVFPGGGGRGGGGLPPGPPLGAPPPHYSPYSPSRFHIDKRCRHSCTWKCSAIALILLSVALTAMLAYFAGKALVYTNYRIKTNLSPQKPRGKTGARGFSGACLDMVTKTRIAPKVPKEYGLKIPSFHKFVIDAKKKWAKYG
ncbi:hypothetical protein AAG570_005801, partial [Ranatra chinensis]